ncbi:MAG: DUF1573 domain-containing protein [Phycisphaerales bacterium]|nr:MAG: DUF1573 domain-containing protein [Phycisphaerales bacterium]
MTGTGRTKKIVLFGLGVCGILGCFGMIMTHILAGRVPEVGGKDAQYTWQNANSNCGVYAALVVLSTLGRPTSANELKSQIVLDGDQVSFGVLQKVIRKHGYKARLGKFTWADLLHHRGMAILWVRGNHFVVADLRDRGQSVGADEERLCVLEINQPGKYWTYEEVRDVWQGESLLVETVSGAERKEPDPAVCWETCFHDFGLVTESEPVKASFCYFNKGMKPLTVGIAKESCSCSRAKLSHEMLQHGERGVLTVELDLANRRGRVQASVLVKSNDPELPFCPIYLNGSVYNSTELSHEVLHLGQIIQGRSKRAVLFVYDRGDNTLEVTNAHLSFSEVMGDSNAISASVKCLPVGAETKIPKAAVPLGVKPGDYVVLVDVAAAATCPVGDVTGTLSISSNRFSSPGLRTIPVKGRVVSHVVASPRAIMIAGQSGRVARVELNLTSEIGKEFSVAEVLYVDRMSSVRAEFTQERINVGAVKLRFSPSLDAAPSTPRSGLVVIALADRTRIEVPLVVYGTSSREDLPTTEHTQRKTKPMSERRN